MPTKGKFDPEKEVKSLRYELTRLQAEIDAIRQQNVAPVSEKKDADNQDPTTSRVLIVEKAPANRESSQNAPLNESKYKLNKTLKTAGTLAGIIYAVITFCMWTDSNKNFRADQRAWITIEPADQRSPIHLQIGDPIQFPITFGNSGKSPAFQVNLKARLITIGPHDDLSFSYDAPKVSAQAPIMFPSQARPTIVTQAMRDGPTPSSPQPVLLDAETSAKIASGNLAVVLFGEITYNDEFKNPHWAHFCQSTPQVRIGFLAEIDQKCLAYNAVDED